jgi:hypothetical protein
MYCHGLGDCFLLRFDTPNESMFNVLIDCGIYKTSPDAAKLMTQVVDDVVATTAGRIDVLVSTHEHWDHISGFGQAIQKFEAETTTVGGVWQAWTEDPKNPLANQLRGKYEKAKEKLIGMMRLAHASLDGAQATALDDAFHIMGFFGIERVGTDSEATGAYKLIKELLASKNPLYCSPGEVLPLGDTGVKVFVLGPPASEMLLRKQNIAKEDAFEKQQMAFFDSFDAMLGAVEAGMDGNAKNDKLSRPFDVGYEVPVEIAQQSEFFQTHYGFDLEHSEAFRTINDLIYETLGGLALRMDRYINNTSLVLAFRLPNGNVLLFPGDAQGGNWKSWADPDKPLEFEAEKTNAHQLLKSTVFYKVSHHGSHNATPRTYGLDLMTHPDLRALVPVDHAIAKQARYGEMPLVAIMETLSTKTGGKVLRSDDVPSDHGIFQFSDKKLSIRISSDSKPFERHMWCETSFEME